MNGDGQLCKHCLIYQRSSCPLSFDLLRIGSWHANLLTVDLANEERFAYWLHGSHSLKRLYHHSSHFSPSRLGGDRSIIVEFAAVQQNCSWLT